MRDRLTEGAANALLKVVEEPPQSTVFLLCAPSVDPEDIAVTLRSRCRHVPLVTPPTAAIAEVLTERDGIAADVAAWAASVRWGTRGPGPPVGDRSGVPAAPRARIEPGPGCRDAVTGLRRSGGTGGLGRGRGQALTVDRNESEAEELRTAMGARRYR